MAGGWNSTTWLVRTAAGPYVAKLVDPSDAEGFTSGLLVAEYAASRGLVSGAPARTRAGQLTVPLHGGALALLRFAPGTPPDLSVPGQVRRAGRALARAHSILVTCPVTPRPQCRWPWAWVTQNLDELAMPAPVAEAARHTWEEVVRAVEKNGLSVSLVHSDPGPDGFLIDAADPERDALIDWSVALHGPLLYDLASFVVMTMSFPHAARWFIEGYLAEAPHMTPQLVHLDTIGKARWVANAIYFCDRIESGTTRGANSQIANEEGLAAAYRGMTANAPWRFQLAGTARTSTRIPWLG